MTDSATSFDRLRKPVFFAPEQRRQQLAADVEVFLKNGGEVVYLPPAGSPECISMRQIEILKHVFQER